MRRARKEGGGDYQQLLGRDFVCDGPVQEVACRVHHVSGMHWVVVHTVVVHAL